MSTADLEHLFGLTGKTALVTGGARGIGMMIARGLLQAGARVTVSSRKADACGQAVAQLSEFGDVRGVPADLSRQDECNDWPARCSPTPTNWTSWSTTPVRRGASRWRAFPRRRGTRCST